MIYLYITRHGMTQWNEEGRLQGHGDSPLTTQGIKDAQALSKLMKHYPIDMIYSSPLMRAYQTACLVFPNRSIIKDERLKEMSFGDYEGRYVSELLDEEDYDALWNHPETFDRIPHGESYAEVYARLHSFLDELSSLKEEHHIFIAIHGMLYVILMSIIKEVPIKELTTLNRSIIRGGALTIVSLEEHSYHLLKETIDTHLDDTKTISYTKK
ncbi:histidine phosphatase family protein [Beduini massiliensis]|uniref:histidine phosphatase family protein n=1 Tax=Beduini massiliensis TaxID=1585974 RepID=UPI000694F50E|nr:histidine phosphatase family protein [Beduini massiliensis]